jgi:MtN3 and saliva related transmembrane protein
MSVAAVIHPLTATPQVIKIYQTQSAEGVSLMTWVLFMALGVVFLAYGIVHRIKPFIVTQVLWFIIDLLIVIGIFLYA